MPAKICHCGAKAYYGYSKEDDYTCRKHKIDGMTEQVRQKCKICQDTAAYRSSKDSLIDLCARHRTKNSKNQHSCKEGSCTNQAQYLSENGLKYCSIHAGMSMQKIIVKKCESCSTCGSYKLNGKYYCSKHSPPGSVSMQQKCETCGIERAVYGFDKARFCSNCCDSSVPNAYKYNLKKKQIFS